MRIHCSSPSPSRLLFTLLSLPALLGGGIVVFAAESMDRWVAANDEANVERTGRWEWNSHRYAADSALETTEDGAALELAFGSGALVLS